MIRLFVKAPLNSQELVSLTENQVHYLLHVMRQKKGDNISLFNGIDGEWIGVINSLDKKQGLIRVNCQVKEQKPEKQIILCPALIKKENMDLVFQKATELGVSDIFPLMTDRTVVNKLNLERAQNIVTEASEQCERLTVPTVHNPVKLKDLWTVLPNGAGVVCLAERGQSTIQTSDIKLPALCIGPEGGWTEKEMKEFEQHQAAFWHFGHTILRAETASIVALVCFQ